METIEATDPFVTMANINATIRNLITSSSRVPPSVRPEFVHDHAPSVEIASIVASFLQAEDVLQLQLNSGVPLLRETADRDTLPDSLEFIQHLGFGGFSRVVKARHSESGNLVVVKILTRNDIVSRTLFRREQIIQSQLVERIQKTNVLVPILESGLDRAGRPFFSMQFTSSISLFDTIKQRRNREMFTAREVFQITRQLASNFVETLGVGVMHADIKPQNVLISTDKHGEFQVHLIDWGIAVVNNSFRELDSIPEDFEYLDNAIEAYCRYSKGLLGTPMYMAPEQVVERHYNESSEIYSASLLALELASLRAPFFLERLLYQVGEASRKSHERVRFYLWVAALFDLMRPPIPIFNDLIPLDHPIQNILAEQLQVEPPFYNEAGLAMNDLLQKFFLGLEALPPAYSAELFAQRLLNMAQERLKRAPADQ